MNYIFLKELKKIWKEKTRFEFVKLFRYHKIICSNLLTLFQITFAPMDIYSKNYLEELFLEQQYVYIGTNNCEAWNTFGHSYVVNPF